MLKGHGRRLPNSMRDIRNALVIQTAFLGDAILTLPLVQVLKRNIPSANVDIMVIPQVTNLLQNNSLLREIIVFDKRGMEGGIAGLVKKIRDVRRRAYDLALVPHRSMRSALIARFGRVPVRVGFDTSAGRLLFNHVVRYEKSLHEVQRNMRLLQPLGIEERGMEYPLLFPSTDDRLAVDRMLGEAGVNESRTVVAVAPGTIWNTKRWPVDRFAELSRKLVQKGFCVALVGGERDVPVCSEILNKVLSSDIFSSAGKLTILQSAELIGRCRVLVCNDSAPSHLAVAMKTPVVAIFGATVPEFGFAPYGKYDTVVETKGLPCRPCAIHGGDKCPISTFDCMVNISAETVLQNTVNALELSGSVK